MSQGQISVVFVIHLMKFIMNHDKTTYIPSIFNNKCRILLVAIEKITVIIHIYIRCVQFHTPLNSDKFLS